VDAPDPGYPTSRCGPCGREVLTHMIVDDAGTAARQCIHCDARIDPEEIRWVLESELDALGYGLFQEGGGCGSGGCGSGGCSR
jgi:hypothetical protein